MTKGLIQGSPISPILSNLYLREFDKLLSDRNLLFCRYGDDINVFCRTEEAAEEAYQIVINILKELHGLDINQEKSGVFYGPQQAYLGYVFQQTADGKTLEAVRVKKKAAKSVNTWDRSCLQIVDRQYHIINEGILSRKDFNILFENEEGKRYIPVETAQALNVQSEVIFSGSFLEFAAKRRLSINLFDKYGNPVGHLESARNGWRSKTMLKQAAIYLDEGRRLQIVKSLEMAAMHNLRANLRYYQKKRKSEVFQDTIEKFGSTISEMNEARDIDRLLMLEARARQMYYAMFNEIIEDKRFAFSIRTRRPPKDPINTLISFGNTYLYNRFATEIAKTSLDVRIGFIHAAGRRDQTLNLDLAELFKPIIVDRAIFTLVNKHMLNVNTCFEAVAEEGVYLNQEGKRIFLRELDNKVYSKQTEGNLSVTYEARIREEVQKILRFVTKDEAYKPYKYTL